MTDRPDPKEIFADALDRTPQEREAFIRSACAGDDALLADVRSLLERHDRGSRFMAAATLPPHSPVVIDLTGTERPGQDVGRYRLLQQLGEGGFGVVFLAEQREPVVRKVALKIIKLGMDTRQVIARFEAERQALAMMDHPNIAKVLDAGATESGRPYFVMELVAGGEPITRYCDNNCLSTQDRLDLFQQVCHAVQHAHQKGIIHRDIKPGNVLVTTADGRPTPKMIDFGIAKATQSRLTEKTLFTELGALIGTPEYMSPEQAEMRGVDIDTRSDIYSLGVLLYELLTGVTPFDSRQLRSAAWAEMQRIIREVEPHKPSTRLSEMKDSLPSVAAHRRTEPARLPSLVRGDLDWIVMKCLEKDRSRRYETANDLALDLGRYADHQPISAAPPSGGYRLRKFVRRNRRAVLAGTTGASMLVLATGVSVAFGLSEAHHRRAAETARSDALAAEGEARLRAAELSRVVEFQSAQLSGIDARTMGVRLRSDLLGKSRAAAERSALSPVEVDARVAQLEQLIAGSDFTGLALRALNDTYFKPAMAAIEKQFADQPLVKARLLQTVAKTLRDVGLLEAAGPPQEEALSIRRRELGDQHADTLNSLAETGRLYHAQGRLADAEPSLREALAGQRLILGAESEATLSTLNSLGALLSERPLPDEAERCHREVLDYRRRTLGDDHPDTLTSMNNLGTLLLTHGRLADAEPYLRPVLERRRRILGDEDPATLTSMVNLAAVLEASGQASAAEPLYLEALEKRRRVLGEDHPETLNSLSNMGYVLQRQHNPKKAEPYCREALERRRRLLGEDHPDTIVSMNNMAFLLLSLRKAPEAEALCRSALERSRRVLGDDHPNSLISMVCLGALLAARGQHAEAIELMMPAKPAARRAFAGDNADRLGQFLSVLGSNETATGQFEAAQSDLTEAYDILRNAPGMPDWNCNVVFLNLENLYQSWHRAAPDQGHDRLAEKWRQTRIELEMGARRGTIKPVSRSTPAAPGT